MKKQADYKINVEFRHIWKSFWLTSLIGIPFGLLMSEMFTPRDAPFSPLLFGFTIVIVFLFNRPQGFAEEESFDNYIQNIFEDVRDEVGFIFSYGVSYASLGRKATDAPGEVYLYLIHFSDDEESGELKRARVSNMICDQTSDTEVYTNHRLTGNNEVKSKTTIREHLTVTFEDGNQEKLNNFDRCKSVINTFNKLKQKTDQKWDSA